MTDAPMTTRTPWHLWLVGGLSLLWNGFGLFDFTMSATQGEAYYRSMGMSEAQIAEVLAMPVWMWVAWVVGVGGAVIGSVLLLMRLRRAVEAFAASLLGAVVSLIYHLFLRPGAGFNGMAVMPLVIVVIAAFLLWYAWAMGKRGVLR